MPLCNSGAGNLLRQNCQTSTMKLLCINSQQPKHVDCFCKKSSTTDLRSDFKCGSAQRGCKSGVWVKCKCLNFVAVGWCRRKELRLYQTITNLTTGDMGIPLVVIWLGVPDWGRSGSCIGAVWFSVCGVPLNDWANGGYVDVWFNCGECGFSSFRSWSCSEE